MGVKDPGPSIGRFPITIIGGQVGIRTLALCVQGRCAAINTTSPCILFLETAGDFIRASTLIDLYPQGYELGVDPRRQRGAAGLSFVEDFELRFS
jgi:hypothetical protein